MAIPERKGYRDNHVRNVRVVRQGEEIESLGKILHKHPVIRNVNTTTPHVSQTGSAPSIDEQFSAGYSQAGIQRSSQTSPPNNSKRIIDRTARTEYFQRPTKTLATKPQRLRIRKKKRKPGAGKVALGRARATGVNVGIWSWGLFTWAVFQVPMAILSAISLAAAIAVDSIKKQLTQVYQDDGWVIAIGKSSFDLIGDLLEDTLGIVFDLFGIDLTLVNPTSLFLVTYTVIIGYALFILLAMYLVYKISFLKPLSGQGAGLKKGMLLLAIIGYSIPVLNLFPWFLFWTAAVWMKPK